MGRVNSESPMRVNAFSYSTAECIVMRYGICELSYPSRGGDNDRDPCASKRHPCSTGGNASPSVDIYRHFRLMNQVTGAGNVWLQRIKAGVPYHCEPGEYRHLKNLGSQDDTMDGPLKSMPF